MNDLVMKKLMQIKDISELLITGADTHHLSLQMRSTLAEVIYDLSDDLVEYSGGNGFQTMEQLAVKMSRPN